MVREAEGFAPPFPPPPPTTDAYTSRIVRGQSILKDVVERYFLERIESRTLESNESLVCLENHESLVCLENHESLVCLCLVEKSKILNLKPNCIYSMQSIEQPFYANCL